MYAVTFDRTGMCMQVQVKQEQLADNIIAQGITVGKSLGISHDTLRVCLFGPAALVISLIP